jgi:anti-sigma B factor antagonist
MALAFSTEKVDSVVVATLKGTIIAGGDTESLMKRVTELLDSGETRIVFDLGQVNYVDSTGIGTLLRAEAAAARKGAAIKLANLTKRIHDVLQVTRLSAVFTIFDGADKAVASFGSPT